jgi:nucleoside-triphosphatase THEP1
MVGASEKASAVNRGGTTLASSQASPGHASQGLLEAWDRDTARIALLTGPVGVGKTTVAERVVGLARRQGLVCGGLLTPAMINPCGQKIGIWGVNIRTGERRILARTDRELGGPAIGPYSFHKASLTWATGVVERALSSSDLLVVDEIGKLELWRGTGLAPILPHLAAGQARQALVLVRESLLSELQARLAPVGQVVFEVSLENRVHLPSQIWEDFMIGGM